ncbi:DUF3301 domain-containing protein [Shewanella litoralis]|uniref:DUF3301 domain-containing protein n=1 Tax=Shewanella litoralis TaxID=2282700 RepID=A0ABQ2RKH0_9GAMM|nr:DUF3301 domain-containing protein [Shewanella litoralis]GGQ34553.1 hypothetical protein GCM10009411_37400 [Shewanella litoralis]
MMSDFLLIVALVVVGAFFWQLRQMAELSRRVAEQSCKKQNVQMLAIAMESARPSIGGSTGICWKATFMFEFSTDGINQYRGHIMMHGNRVTKIQWPIFPEPEWMDAPMASGKFGGCGSSQSCNSGKCH